MASEAIRDDRVRWFPSGPAAASGPEEDKNRDSDRYRGDGYDHPRLQFPFHPARPSPGTRRCPDPFKNPDFSRFHQPMANQSGCRRDPLPAAGPAWVQPSPRSRSCSARLGAHGPFGGVAGAARSAGGRTGTPRLLRSGGRGASRRGPAARGPAPLVSRPEPFRRVPSALGVQAKAVHFSLVREDSTVFSMKRTPRAPSTSPG